MNVQGLRRCGLAVLLVLAADCVAPAQAPSLELRTDHFPTPLPFRRSKQTLQATRFRLRIDGPEGEGKGALIVEEEKLVFNDFGDAKRVDGKEPITYPIRFRPVNVGSHSARQVYEVVFEKDRLDTPLHFAWYGERANAHYLNIFAPGISGSSDPAWQWELRPPKTFPDELGENPQVDYFRFESFRMWRPKDPLPVTYPRRLTRIELIRRTMDGVLRADFDPNGVRFFGDRRAHGGTAIGYRPLFAQGAALGADPARLGRRAFRYYFGGQDRVELIVVLAATDLGPHRLLVKESGALRAILPLKDKERDNHIAMQGKLQTTPPAEQEAIRQIHKLRGYTFRFAVQNERVTKIESLCGGAADLDDALKRLPRLKYLEFQNARISGPSLKCLADLRQLDHLVIEYCDITQDGLKNLALAPALKSLTVNASQGVQPNSLAPLAKLGELESLFLSGVYRDPFGPEKMPNFAEAMKYVKDLKNLKRLHITQLRIADEGVAQLAGLKNLEELSLDAGDLSYEGLKTIAGLKGLTSLRLFYWKGGPSDEKLRWLAQQLPKLKDGP